MPILNWLTRDEDVRAATRVPYRLLEEVSDLSAGDPATGNMLIQGDNLEALKALLPFYAGQVKCIYIDPPFNTGEAFPDYDDNREHSIWLAMMQPRMALLHDLLAEDGTLVLHLDDNEIAYATVLLDEIFGRKNRTYMVTFKQSAPKGHKTINPGLVTIANYAVIYAKDKSYWKPNRAFAARPRDKRYSSFIENFDADMQNWALVPVTKAFCERLGVRTISEAKKALKDEYESNLDAFVLENADRVVQPVSPDYDEVGKETQELIDISTKDPSRVYRQERADHLDIFLKGGKRWLFYSSKLRMIDGKYTTGEALSNIWDDLLSNNLHNEGGVSFSKGKKPEALVKRVFDLFSNPNDVVLDSFLGSGTTAAVAHKMRRRWIGVEMGDHAVTHCSRRLGEVVKGEQGGISKSVGWKGGGGFRFYRLGPPVVDEEGHIRSDIRFPVLAAHVWFSETATPWTAPHAKSNEVGTGSREDFAAIKNPGTPFLGVHDGRAFALLYNGILGDKRPDGGNVLTRPTLALIRDAIRTADPAFDGPVTVYGEQSRITAPTLERERVTFKQTPYDVKARR